MKPRLKHLTRRLLLSILNIPAKMSLALNGPFPLLALPTEVRLQIFEALFEGRAFFKGPRLPGAARHDPTAVLRVSKQINAEAREAMFSVATFAIPSTESPSFDTEVAPQVLNMGFHYEGPSSRSEQARKLTRLPPRMPKLRSVTLECESILIGLYTRAHVNNNGLPTEEGLQMLQDLIATKVCHLGYKSPEMHDLVKALDQRGLQLRIMTKIDRTCRSSDNKNWVIPPYKDVVIDPVAGVFWVWDVYGQWQDTVRCPELKVSRRWG